MGRRQTVRIGVLDLQGAVEEHVRMTRRAGAEAVPVKVPAQLERLQGLIIPGGESTTIGRLMREYGFMDAVPRATERGLAVWGTCAGLIVMAREIEDGVAGQPRLGLMDLTVVRNGFGRQVESFEADLAIDGLGSKPYTGVFIRAPYVSRAGQGVLALARFDGKTIMARQDRFLVTAFHPELTGDARIHRYFAGLAREGPAPEED